MIESEQFTLEQIQKVADKYFEINGTGKGSGYKQYKRWEYIASLELDENGYRMSTKSMNNSIRKYRSGLTKSGEMPPASGSTGNWQELGPTYWDATSGWNPGVGRVTSIAVEEGNQNHIIIGAPNGGVWKTIDGGQNWTPLTDNFSTIDVWSLEIDPADNQHYIWGGDGDIYESKNGGLTWTTTTMSGKNPFSNFIRIAFHPTNSNIVFAVGEFDGLFKSTNGGSSWTYVANTDQSRNYDFEFKPGDPNTCYYITNNVYKSTNGGDSFSQIGGFSTGHKMAAVSPANPNIVMVLEASGSRFGALYKSTNSGTSFTKIIDYDVTKINYFGYEDDGDDTRGQAPRDMDICISNTDINEVHIGGIQTWKSFNGGQSFSLSSYWTPSGAASRNVGYNHADIDILKYIGNTLYVGSDGGIYKSNNKASSFTDLSTGLGIREFYKIGVSKTDPNVVSGGSQDNGTSVMRNNNREWKCWLGADGMETFVDWNNPNNLYGTSQNGTMYRSTNKGNSRFGITGPGGDGNWVTPFEQDPQVANTIYVAYAEVYKSTNQGSGWTTISNFGGGNIEQMKLAPSNNQYIYIADGSTLRLTKNGGTSWTTPTKAWGTSGINFISIHPNNPERVAIVVSNGVYISTDAGNSWTNYTKNLPSASKYCATWEDNGKNGLYVGGFGFIMYIQDGMTDYVDFMSGLPNVRVQELEINYVSDKIFAGTYGRGLWESDVYSENLNDYDLAIQSLNGISDICGDSALPTLTIRNNGATTITNYTIKVYLNNLLVQTINKNSNLSNGDSEIINLDEITYITSGTNTVKVTIENPNGQQDQFIDDNEIEETATVSFGTLHEFYIHDRSQNNGLTWSIQKNASTEISNTDVTANINGLFSIQEFCLAPDCYDFVINTPFSSGGCNDPAYDPSKVYLGDSGSGGAGTGEIVSYNGKRYRAQWWTQGNTPSGGGSWLLLGDCNVNIPTDVFGLRKKGETAYFEVDNSSPISSDTKSFCSEDIVVVDFTANTTTTDHCEDVTFTTQNTGTTITWEFGLNAVPATANGAGPHLVQYTSIGTKTVSLTVDGTTETKTNYITVNEDFNKTGSINLSVVKSPTCIGDEFIISSSGINLGANPTYTWYINGIKNSEKGNSITGNTLSKLDSVLVEVIADNACLIGNNKLVANFETFNSTPNIVPTLSITAEDDNWPKCVGDEVTFNATTNTGSTIQWYVNNNFTNTTGASFTIEPNNDDSVYAKVALTGCYTDLNPSSNSIVAQVDICTNTNEIANNNNLSLFPNPTKDIVTVTGDNIIKIVVVDVQGSEVINITPSTTNSIVDLSEYSSGAYFITITYKGENTSTHKVNKI